MNTVDLMTETFPIRFGDAPPDPPLSLRNNLMTKLKPARIYKGAVDSLPQPSPSFPPRPGNQGPRHITGICFDDRGDQEITAAEGETFRLYNCKSGKPLKTLFSKKYGVDLLRFTHKNTAIIHVSTKEDDTVRYHSLHDNKYLQYFKGHKGRVISLGMSLVDDGFIPNCRGLLSLPSTPIVTYDSTGMVFAVAVNHYSRILLYDHANYDKAPFLVITMEDPTVSFVSYPPRPIFMTSLSFSSNGKYILVGCSGDAHYILDAFEGHLLAKLQGHIGLEGRSTAVPPTIEPAKGGSGEEVSWTPDSRYIVSGSLDGKVHVWDSGPVDLRAASVRLQLLGPLEGHAGPSRCVKFNPRFAMMCSAGAELAFWLPDTSGVM
ncbi:WD40-repeat-containing domain protein [Desarmillaria tabescens]|uniref:WD40-repeat-containing domain protein n=1 Tax=Armillaria tabescens TaxID=1929756 RepID=A0AA39JKX7_ARMTA|nr:WD40-repeat-containing domain protein [Desarmillaria tabescens]KAK0444655.1 WD40-repeat-containing domain protein [Desarmillaria tabescens]